MFYGEYGFLKLSWAIAFMTVSCVAVFSLLVLGSRQFQHYTASTECAKFTAATGHVVKFVDYTFRSWDCLVQTPSDRWIPLERLRSGVFVCFRTDNPSEQCLDEELKQDKGI